MEPWTKRVLVVAAVVVGAVLALRICGVRWYTIEVGGNGIAYRMDRLTGETWRSVPDWPWEIVPEPKEEKKAEPTPVKPVESAPGSGAFYEKEIDEFLEGGEPREGAPGEK